MIGLLTATIILSIIHALIPNHWLPLVAVAKAEKWEVKELMLVGFASALAHVLGTIALGIVLGRGRLLDRRLRGSRPRCAAGEGDDRPPRAQQRKGGGDTDRPRARDRRLRHHPGRRSGI